MNLSQVNQITTIIFQLTFPIRGKFREVIELINDPSLSYSYSFMKKALEAFAKVLGIDDFSAFLEDDIREKIAEYFGKQGKRDLAIKIGEKIKSSWTKEKLFGTLGVFS